MQLGLHRIRAFLVGLLVCLGSPFSAFADDPVGEIFIGGAMTQNSWISWAGGVKALSFDEGDHASLYRPGWRLRVLGAYGGYRFTTNNEHNRARPALFEITPGYQFHTGPLISKIYFGLHGEDHKLDHPDRTNEAAGMGYGAKFISENWIDLPMNSFASLDASYSTLNKSYQSMLRGGSAYFMPQLELGLETGVVGNGEYYQLRLGGLMRWKLSDGSLEASGGIAEDYNKKRTPYAGLSWLKRF